MEKFSVPKLPLDDWIDSGLDFMTENFAFLTKAISKDLKEVIEHIVEGLMFFPPYVVIVIFSLMGWWLAGRKVGIFTAIGLGLLWNLRLWEPTMATLTLVLVATFLAVLVGLPMGILAALSRTAYRLIMPLMDFKRCRLLFT